MTSGWRLGWSRIDCARVRASLTGRPRSHAASAVWAWTERSSLPPKAPPFETSSTSTCSLGRPSTSAIWRWSSWTPWPWVKTRTPSGVGSATHASGSRKACSMRWVVKVSSTTCAEAARAASTSPRRKPHASSRLPPSCTAGAPGARAASGSVTGSRGSRETLTSSAARRAWKRVSATTTASTSPTQRVVSPGATSTGQSRTIRPTKRSPGTSAAVSTRTTPGAARASAGSIARTTARGCSASTSAACSVPGAERSATKGFSPSTSASPRHRGAAAPTPQV